MRYTDAKQSNRANSTNYKMRVITQNPYRVLGMYANDSTKVMTANIAKLRAYSKVGKICEFESDYSSIFGTVDRSDESIEEAIKNLSNEDDQNYYKLFWLHSSKTLTSKFNSILEILKSATDDDFCLSLIHI